MKNYKKIPFESIENIESYIEEKLRNGHIIIQISVNDTRKEIDELISYANDTECQSYYVGFTDSDEQLRTSVIVERMEPYYAFKDEKRSEILCCCDIDIKTDTQDAIDFSTFKEDFKSMEEYYNGKSVQFDDGFAHYEFYVSIEKGDIRNFGGPLESEFVTEWMTEQGYYQI